MPSDALSGIQNSLSGNSSNSNKYGAAISSIFDKRTNELPNIIYAFRNGRTESVGNEDPTYFGFYIDIHSTNSEAKDIENPFTGPDPIKNNINAEINVVILASNIAVLDFLYPSSKAIILLFYF